jgi:serine/threonine-protein kinase
MTADEWARVKDLFGAAVELPAAARDRYLRDVCPKNSQLRSTVAELLRNHENITGAERQYRTLGAPTFKIGDLVAGRFRILRFIAAGGMGEVYEACDERLSLRVALKTLRSALMSESDALKRFEREIVVARSVSHVNLCRVYDFVEHRTDPGEYSVARVIPCLTMELLDGESLAQFLARSRPLSICEAQPLVEQIAEGLAILHQHSVVHRDLKPSNVMLASRKGNVRAVVMDFGLAKPEDAEGDLFESLAGIQAGAPYFMAPELLRGAKPSFASDLYALGLIVDEMVTRSRAFSAESIQSLYFAKLWETPSPPSSRADGLPLQWDRAVLRCLEKDPAARFASVREFIRALQSPDSAVATPSRPSLPRALHSRMPRRSLLVGAAVLPVLTGVAAVASIAFRRVQTTVEVFNIENLTESPKYDYFCKGIASELMRGLLHLEGVLVVPVYGTRSASRSKRLGQFSLDGLLQAERGAIRLSVKLTDNQTGALVWSENYNRRPVENPIELESEIARGVVMALDERLLSGNASGSSRGLLTMAALPLRRIFAMQFGGALPVPPTSSNVAFDLYMRGHSLLEDLSPSSTVRAVEYFQRAIDEDPSFALAYAAVADAQISSLNYDVYPPAQVLQSARSYALQSVRRDPNLAEAHTVLAAVKQLDWDWSDAEAQFREALRLKPNYSRARRWYAGLILQFGRYEEAIAETRRSLDLDPYDHSGPATFGQVLTLARRFDQAEDVMVRSLAAKDLVLTRLNLAQLYAWVGHINTGATSVSAYAKAFTQIRAAIELERRNSGDLLITDAMQALLYTMMGNNAAASSYLQRSEAAMENSTLSPVLVAKVYAARGDSNRAIDLLFRAAENRDRRLFYINVTPFFETLRDRPRFQALLAHMKL